VRRALIPNGKTVVLSEPRLTVGEQSSLWIRNGRCAQGSGGQAARRAARVERQRKRLKLHLTKEDARLTTPRCQSLLRQAVKRALLPEIRLHDLRHTHATLALRAGIHPKVVSERLDTPPSRSP